jgi:signal transduction histidine kinase/ActR/RegA family two-component response regulator
METLPIPYQLFDGDGELRALMRAHDWSSSALGEPATWPPELQTVVELMLAAKYPTVVAWGPQAIFLYNDAYAYILGSRHPSALGCAFADVWPEIWHEIEPIVAQALKGIPACFEDMPVMIEPEGRPEQRWFTSSYTPVRNQRGEVLGMLNAGFETTGRVLQEKRLAFQAALGERLRSLASPDEVILAACASLGRQLGVARVGFVEVDASGTACVLTPDWNSGALPSMAGAQSRFDDVGPHIGAALRAGQTVAIDDVGADPRCHALAGVGQGVRSMLGVPLLKYGRIEGVLQVHHTEAHHWTELDRRLSEDTVVLAWAAVERGFEEQKRRQAEARLMDADRRKDEFLAMLAHELRNPLAPIGAAAELLQIVPADQAQVRKTSQIIARQVGHMSSLIDDLLDVSRVTRGLVELDRTPLDIAHVVSDAVEQVTPLVRSRRQHLALQLAPDTTLVMGDRKRLVQVLANILNNAAKYTHEGGNIYLKTDVREQHVLITVTDDGIGMTADLVSRAFELFTQAERSSDRSSGGLGLGLALVKSLVELHGGTVRCASDGTGRGSSFTICLPRLEAQERHDQPERRRSGMQGSQRSLRIMVVDDNVDAASMLVMLLEASGHRVSVEHGSRRALERARIEAPQVCLLDIGLPEMDGNKLAQALRSMPETATAVLIAITGYGQESDRQRTLAAGFDHHLVKPVDIRKLAGILDKVVVA